MRKMFSNLFPRHKARADQAGFIRRGLAFGMDGLIIGLLSFIVYSGYAELRARMQHEKSPISQVVQSLEEGKNFSLTLEEGLKTQKDKKQEYLELLKGKIPDEEYQKAAGLTAEEIYQTYKKELATIRAETASEQVQEKLRSRGEDNAYKVIKEYIITLLYFVLFFRYGGRTPGKRFFGLKVIDLEGKPRLSWYQCFERAHGYVCSGLFASLGFWQVLWDRHGLTMHDKIADTTVIRVPKKAKKRSS